MDNLTNKKTRLLALAMPLACLAFMTSCKGNDESVLTPKTLASECVKTLCGLSIYRPNNINEIEIPSSLKRVDVLIDNIDFDNCITVEALTSDKTEYVNRQKVTFKSKDEKINYNFELYFNDVTTKEKEKETKTEIKSAFEGLCKYTPVGSTTTLESKFKAKTETETSSKKTEAESKFKLFEQGSDVNYIELQCEKETSTKKTEYEYTYEIFDGDKTEKSIKIENKNSETYVTLEEEFDTNDEEEEEIEFTRTVLTNDVEYKEKEEGTVYHRVFDEKGDFTYKVK